MRILEEMREESFTTISNDNRYRVYANPTKGLVELEEMDQCGELVDCVATSCFFVTGTDDQRLRAVLRFLGFLDKWDEQYEGNLSRGDALQVFDAMVNLALISISTQE